MSSDEELVIDENDDDIERDKESDSSSGSDSDTWSVSDLRTKFDEGEDEDDDEPKVGDEEFKKIIGVIIVYMNFCLCEKFILFRRNFFHHKKKKKWKSQNQISYLLLVLSEMYFMKL